MRSGWAAPVNIGSEEIVTINRLAEMIMEVANKKQALKQIDGPLGVRSRNSDKTLINEKLNWKPSAPLRDGSSRSYIWISAQVEEKRLDA